MVRYQDKDDPITLFFVYLIIAGVMFLAVGWPILSHYFGPENIDIKDRAESVDVSDFEYFRCSGLCGQVQNAWYDSDNSYLIVGEPTPTSGDTGKTTNYHYCRVPQKIWDDFKNGRGIGEASNSKTIYIYEWHIVGEGREDYDCRADNGRYVPDY